MYDKTHINTFISREKGLASQPILRIIY